MEGFEQGQKQFRLAPYSYAEAAEIASALELPHAVAAALVRRGHRTVSDARTFLAADVRHEPAEFHGIDVAVGLIQAAIDSGKRITVHGDYDVDGVTSTAILVSVLRELGADCDWLIPGRVDDGYGLTAATVEKLRARGTGLLITADCGITSVDEVAAAKAAGIEVVVTDHHQPGDTLPDCPIVHPVVSGYPCEHLCAAGVAHKLAAALTTVGRAEQDLDLVALATIADMVPLTGENRSLVRRGLELARRSPRLGLRKLMEVAQVAPERLDETDCSFRLAPRINAAGRLYRADAAVELLLTDDERRAGEIATELDRANYDRRETEAEVIAEANRLLSELEAESGPAAAIVLWGEGWHPGVVGICASRLAERHLRPAILIALDAEGRGKGSGRSIPGFDLLAGLQECGQLLARFGGHRAAAGLEIESESLEGFRERFCAHVAQALEVAPLAKVEDIDAVTGAESLGHHLATQIARMGPFGMGNPGVRLVVPAARVTDVRPMGEEGRHARFSLSGGGARAGGVAFGVGSTLERAAASGPHDASLKLELNEWNGAVEPRVVLGTLYEPVPAEPDDPWVCDEAEFARRLAAGLTGPTAFPGPGFEIAQARHVVDRRRASGLATIGELASSGEPVLVACADALWRRGIAENAVPPARYGGGEVAVVASRGSIDRGLEAAARVRDGGGVVIADWGALASEPDLAAGFRHVVIADSAPHPALEASVSAAGEDGGYLHLIPADDQLTIRALANTLPGRDELASAYRSLSGAEGASPLSGEGLRAAFAGPGGSGLSPEACALTLRILAEIGVVRVHANSHATAVEVVSSVRGELSSSVSFRSTEKAHEECVRFLTAPKTQSSSPLQAAA